MPSKLSYEEIHNAIHTEWDPIGIGYLNGEHGEYDAYVPNLFKLLNSAPTVNQIFDYLWEIETITMGLPGNSEATYKFACYLYSISND